MNCSTVVTGGAVVVVLAGVEDIVVVAISGAGVRENRANAPLSVTATIKRSQRASRRLLNNGHSLTFSWLTTQYN